MPQEYSVPIYSVEDIIAALASYDASDEAKEPIMYFVSELTGLSVDAIAGALSSRKARGGDSHEA